MNNTHPRFSFKLVAPPFLNHPIDVPPVLNASDPPSILCADSVGRC